MNTIRRGRPVLLASAALALAVAACGGPAMDGDHTVLDDGLQPLRTAFNADSGKVRAIFLASPT